MIIKARGVSATQGVYEARLTPVNEDETPEDGVLIYRLEARNDESRNAQGASKTREVVVGRKRTEQELAGATRVRIESATNAVEARL